MIFKSTENIFKDFGEFFDSSWMDSDTVTTPPSTPWDYSRELQIEDVDIWEVIYEKGGGIGVYASWSPYAEFYLVKSSSESKGYGYNIETYYGPGSMKKVMKRMDEMGIPYGVNKVWVEPEDMPLYME
jgi:hypothetical protein